VSVLEGLQSIGLKRCLQRVPIGFWVCFYGTVVASWYRDGGSDDD
jgi:hypothetical protein